MIGKALTFVPATAVAKAQPAALPATPPIVQEAMLDLLVACPPPAGEQSPDRVRLLRIWARETSKFLPEIVAEAAETLLTDNPRNPFRPSPQDLVERCHKIQRRHSDLIDRYYSGHDLEPPPGWCAPLVAAIMDCKLNQLRESHRYDRPITNEVDPVQYLSWQMADRIGPRLAEWPVDLLAKYGVLVGTEFDRINAIIRAAQERKRVQQARRDEWRRACEIARREHKEAYSDAWYVGTNDDRIRLISDIVRHDAYYYPELAKQLKEDGKFTRLPEDDEAFF
jgi:hypothetical protein